jgi:hypothetical protein
LKKKQALVLLLFIPTNVATVTRKVSRQGRNETAKSATPFYHRAGLVSE